VFGAVVDLSKWLIDKLGPSPAALIVVFILLIGGGGIFYVMRNDPVLLTTKYPYVSPKYPSEGLEQLIPQQQDNKLVVLFHRVVWDLDHWNFANDGSNCVPNVGDRTKCDEAHAYSSWTVIVPTARDVKLTGTSATSSGEFGDVLPLTPHTVHKDKPIDGKQNWYVSKFASPPGQVDVIIVRRDFFGGFQPISHGSFKSWEPQINKCQGNSAGIVVRNPTARAELIFHAPPEMLINKTDFRLWRYRASTNRVEDITGEGSSIGSADVQVDNIHWILGSSLLRDAGNDEIAYQVSWTWARPITTGPHCQSPSGTR
jgi:hypothetical protein